MSDYNVLQAALSTVVTWGTGGLQAVWEEEPRQHMIPPYAILSGPDNITPVGMDWVKWTDGKAEVQAPRTGVVSVRIISHIQTPANSRAGWLIELLRMSFALPDVPEALNAVGLAIAGTGDVRQVTYVGSTQRAESIATLDLYLNWVPDALAPATDYGFIRSVSGTKIIDGASPVSWGVALP